MDPSYKDPVIEFYRKDVDRTLLRQNLLLTPEQRLKKFAAALKMVEGLRKAKIKTVPKSSS